MLLVSRPQRDTDISSDLWKTRHHKKKKQLKVWQKPNPHRVPDLTPRLSIAVHSGKWNSTHCNVGLREHHAHVSELQDMFVIVMNAVQVNYSLMGYIKFDFEMPVERNSPTYRCNYQRNPSKTSVHIISNHLDKCETPTQIPIDMCV